MSSAVWQENVGFSERLGPGGKAVSAAKVRRPPLPARSSQRGSDRGFVGCESSMSRSAPARSTVNIGILRGERRDVGSFRVAATGIHDYDGLP